MLGSSPPPSWSVGITRWGGNPTDLPDTPRHHIVDESVEFIYPDPPFNSNADYNVLFAEKSGEKAHSRIKAFADTWTWDAQAAAEYEQVVASGHERVSKRLQGVHAFLGATT